MTEKQGGSDVRAGTDAGHRTGDGTFQLTGHKWFISAPMCDIFLVLAQARGDGTRRLMFLPAAGPARRHRNRCSSSA